MNANHLELAKRLVAVTSEGAESKIDMVLRATMSPTLIKDVLTAQGEDPNDPEMKTFLGRFETSYGDMLRGAVKALNDEQVRIWAEGCSTDELVTLVEMVESDAYALTQAKTAELTPQIMQASNALIMQAFPKMMSAMMGIEDPDGQHGADLLSGKGVVAKNIDGDGYSAFQADSISAEVIEAETPIDEQ